MKHALLFAVIFALMGIVGGMDRQDQERLEQSKKQFMAENPYWFE